MLRGLDEVHSRCLFYIQSNQKSLNTNKWEWNMFFVPAINVLLIMSHWSETGAGAARTPRLTIINLYKQALGGFSGGTLCFSRSSMPHPFINTGELLSQHGNHLNGNYVFMTFVDSEGKKESVQELHGKSNGGSFTPLFKTFSVQICRTHYGRRVGTTLLEITLYLHDFMKHTCDYCKL